MAAPPDSTSCTPTLSSCAIAPPSPLVIGVPVGCPPPTRKLPASSRPETQLSDEAILRSPKTPRLEGDSDAASSLVSRQLLPAAALKADPPASEEKDSGDEDDSTDNEDDGLQYLVKQRLAKQRQTPSRSLLDSSKTRSSNAAILVSPDAGTADEDGFMSSQSRRGRRSTGSTTSEVTPVRKPDLSAGVNTPDASACAASGSGGCDDEEDYVVDDLYSAYSAAKSSERRVKGKHSRSTLQSVQRGFAIEARQAQRAASQAKTR
ncbi:MAG: hypothetical protein SGPRY_010236 [Prymnesium sp.]